MDLVLFCEKKVMLQPLTLLRLQCVFDVRPRFRAKCRK